MTEQPNQKLIDALAQRRLQKAQEAERAKASHPSQYTPTPEYDDVVPDADVAYERTEADIELDRAVERIDIIDAYNKWIRKMTPEVGRKRESIMISCPYPWHADNHPSAWINLDKQTWYCPGCNQGGDTFDFAAIGLGYDVDHYKGSDFGKLKREMAESFGYTYERTIAGPVWVEPEPATPSPVTTPTTDAPAVREDAPLSEPMAEVVDLFTRATRETKTVGIEWRDIIPANTFLRTYLEMVTQDDVPEEYHFWNGMVAISLALGRDATLKEASPVFGNLFVCLLGDTGHGKSRSQGYLKKLLSMALPYDANDTFSKGAKIVPEVASAEALINAFRKPIMDPSGGGVVGYAPVRGFVNFSELSSLMGRANRQGNILKPQLIDMYDAGDMQTSSMTRGDIVARDTYGCVMSTSQPDALRGLLTAEDATSGFLNRWVFAFARHKEQVWINRFEADLTTSADALKNIQGWIGFGKQIDWSEEAEKLAAEHFRSVIQPTKQSNPMVSRLDLLTKKLILLFAANSMHDHVEVSDVEQAISLHQYLVDAFVSTEASVKATKRGDVEDKVLELIEEMEAGGGRNATASTISRRLKSYDRVDVSQAIETLIKMELIKPFRVNEGQRGRPTFEYRINREG